MLLPVFWTRQILSLKVDASPAMTTSAKVHFNGYWKAQDYRTRGRRLLHIKLLFAVDGLPLAAQDDG
jgi:hypothetical protein